MHSLATDHTTEDLGKARIVGVDEATGLAVIQIESQKPLEIFDGLEPIRFQPDYRAIDPKTNVYLAEIFEPRINANKVGDNPSLALVHPHSSNTTYDDALENTNVARLTMIPDSSVEAGTPILQLDRRMCWFKPPRNLGRKVESRLDSVRGMRTYCFKIGCLWQSRASLLAVNGHRRHITAKDSFR